MSECREIASVETKIGTLFVCVDPDDRDGDAFIGYDGQTTTMTIPKDAREAIGLALLGSGEKPLLRTLVWNAIGQCVAFGTYPSRDEHAFYESLFPGIVSDYYGRDVPLPEDGR